MPCAADGQLYLLFIPGGVNFPLDGVRYMEHEHRYTIPLPGGRVRDSRHLLTLYLSQNPPSIGTRGYRSTSRLYTPLRGDGRLARPQAVPSPEGGSPIPRPRPLYTRTIHPSVFLLFSFLVPHFARADPPISPCATVSRPASSTSTTRSTIPSAPTQRAGRLRARREARTARTTFGYRRWRGRGNGHGHGHERRRRRAV